MKRLLKCTFCTSAILMSMSAISYADFLPAPKAAHDPYEPRLFPKEMGSAIFAD
jgi:xanthine dehydrogenase iron-sulfur cluster and FAD-binding subunit A